MSTTLACPHCKSTRLRSDEVAAIGYPVILTRGPGGAVDVEYTGGDRDVWDEGTVYSGDIWCRDCGEQIAESDLTDTEEDTRTRDDTRPAWPRLANDADKAADDDHTAIGEDDCQTCGLAVVGDGRHGLLIGPGDPEWT